MLARFSTLKDLIVVSLEYAYGQDWKLNITSWPPFGWEVSVWHNWVLFQYHFLKQSQKSPASTVSEFNFMQKRDHAQRICDHRRTFKTKVCSDLFLAHWGNKLTLLCVIFLGMYCDTPFTAFLMSGTSSIAQHLSLKQNGICLNQWH